MTSQGRVLATSILLGTIISATIALTASAQPTSCAPPPTGLVSWWAAEGNALDLVGTNNGVLVNGAGFGAGEVGQAFLFDGNTQAFFIPYTRSLLTTNYSAEAWVKPLTQVSDPSNQEQIIGQAGGWQLAVRTGASGVKVAFFFANSTGGFPGVVSTTELPLGQFSHVVGTWDGTTLRLYFNGVLNAQSVPGTTPVDSGRELHIGGSRDGSTAVQCFHGLVDEASYYSRALGAAEIQTLFAAGSAGKCQTPVPPSIITPPQNQAVPPGGTVSFAVIAAGTSPLSYQWRFNGAGIAGATSSVLTLTNAQLASVGTYAVTVTNLYGSANSAGATLTLLGTGACTPPPAGLVSWWTAEGTAADAVGTNNGVLVNGAGFGAGEVGQAFLFDGNTQAFFIPYTRSLLTTNYSAEAWVKPLTQVSDPINQEQLIGQAGGWQLVVRPGASGVIAEFLIATSTGSFPGVVGTTELPLGQFSHVAGTWDGTTLRLYINGVLNAQSVPGATPFDSGRELHIGGSRDGSTAVQCFHGLIDEASYYSRALSGAEIQSIYNAGSAGKCPPGVAPSIITQPASLAVNAGATAAFTVTAAGTPPLNYQWRLNGTNVAGTTGTSLTLSNVQSVQAGSYAVRVTNTFGSILSSNAVLTVNQAPPCAPPPSGLVSWWRGEGIASDFAGTNNGVLEGGVAFAAGEVGQAFKFNGTNADVRVPASASLNVGLADGFTVEAWINPADLTQQRPVVEWNDGQFGVNFWVSVAGTGPGSLFINVKDTTPQDHSLSTAAGLLSSNVWQHVAATYMRSNGNTVLYINGLARAQATLGVFTPRTIGDLYFGLRPYSAGAGSRFVGLMDEVSLYNRALSAAEVLAIYNADGAGKCPQGVAPSIITQPASLAVNAGATAAFTVTAAGTPPLNYQWRLNGTNIAGATATSLSLSNVQSAQAGSYAVRVTNTFGSILSSNAVLTVNQAPPCATPPSGLVSWWRAEGSASDGVDSNNGTLLNGASFAPGMVGQAFSFNGNNQCVQVPHAASLVASNYSIEAWVKPLAQVSDAINQDLIFGQTFGHCQLVARTGNTGVRPAFSFGTDHFTFFEVAGTGEIPIGQFSHLVGTWDGTTLRLYINGVLNAQATPHASPVDSGCPFYIGGTYNPTADSCGYVGQFFNGLIDEASYYSRALSGAEIQSIYNAGGAGKCPSGVAPSIITQPASLAVNAGSTATFTVTATGTPPLNYQWRLNGTNIAGATGTALTLSNVQSAQAGSYAVRVTNTFGSVVSSNALLTVNQAPPCAPPPSGLVSWWKAESTTVDSGGSNNGTLVGNTTYGAGRVGQAFLFDGLGDGVSVGNPTNLQLQNFTIEAWIKRANGSLASYGGEGAGHIFGGSYGGYVLGLWDDGQPTLGQIGTSGVESSRVIADTTSFHHVAVTKNGSTVMFYVDGVGETAAAYNPGFVFSGSFVIGARGGDYGASFLGSIDEVSFYNRALTSAEIQSIYNADGTGKCPLGVAPSIITQPANLAVKAGATAAFTVTAAGTPPLSYQWQFNGTNVAGATGTALTLSNVQSAQAGSYTVRVTNTFGSIMSSNAVLTVNQAPPCATPPAGLVSWWRAEGNALDQAGTNNGTLVGNTTYGAGRVGQAFVFDGSGDAVSVGTPTNLQLQNFTIEAWVKRSSTTRGSQDSSGSGAIYNCTWGGYCFNVCDDGRLALGKIGYSAVYSTRTITDTNNFHHITVTKNGSVVAFYVDGNGETAAAYDPGFEFNGPSAIGGRGSDYRTSFLGSIDEVSIYNRALAAAEIQAIYNADGAGKCTALTAPFITSQPTNQTVTAGGTATFTVAADGTPPLNYQWRWNGTNLAGATGTALTLSNVQSAQAGSYAVRVTNTFGSVLSSNAVLTVNSTPSCSPPPSGLVSWWRAEGNGNDAAGTNTATLQGGLSFTNGRVGHCFQFNGVDASLRVPASSTLNVGAGGGLTIECWIDPVSVSAQMPIVEWNSGTFGVMFWVAVPTLYGGGGPGSLYAGLFDTASGSHSLATPGGTLSANRYQHVAMTYDKSSGAAALYLNGVVAAQANLGVFTPGTTADLNIGFRPYGGAAGTRFQGQMDEISLYSRALSASEIQAIYIAGSAGKCPLGVAPSIITQPAGLAVNAGATAAFSVTAAGTTPLSYQWRYNGTNIAGATGTALTLSNVQSAQAGSYAMRVTNTFGSVVSSNALLTVISSPPCATRPAGLVSWWRAEGSANDGVASNNGTLLNGASFASGMVGQAFSFNGSNQCVQVPHAASLVASNYSIEAWVKPLAQVSDAINQDLIFGQIFGRCQLVVRTGSLGVRLAFAFGTSQNSFYEATGTSEIPIGQFSHLAGTWDGTTLRLYINGVLNAQSTPHASPVDSGCPFSIGGFYSPTADSCGYVGQFFNGLIDEASYYSRALSGAEIQSIYNAGGVGKCPQGRQVLHLRLQVGLNPDGTTRVQFVGNNSQSYRIEVSVDMVKWGLLGTCTADDQGNVEFSDPNVAKQPLRFYRAVEQ